MIAVVGVDYDAAGWVIVLDLFDDNGKHVLSKWDGDHVESSMEDFFCTRRMVLEMARRINDGGPQRERVLRRLGR